MHHNAKLLAAIALLLCCTLLAASLFEATEGLLFSKPLSAQASEQPIILLDAGHGGEDGGASGTNGILEKDLNLSLTKALAEILRAAGFSVVEVRPEDRLLCAEDAPKGTRKRDDLKSRLAFMQKYPNSLFVSIHMNTFPAADCEGLQVWYSQNHAESQQWAKAVQSAVKAHLQPQNNRKIKAATSSIYLLKHAQTPAILVECGFISSKDECERLCDPAYRQKLATVLFAAISEKILANSCENSASML